ncbi:glycine--tRNA ligase [Hyperthermus butylicus]|uniref:Glycine--tRNA ligase n=1 Tax=Hyperthermus butylicus (strain DSM 5456 / JCM 9403 / PLM1-5) TaxID=415426 RepID=A2BIW7_HYPBU|nr:glycine--tRNA ligase [Hyperthermus butylicus]ABM79928.1 glycyl-tRNA synthetase [Hyperthermus butylicus DSM 5456]
MAKPVDKYEKLVDLAIRRGFFWPSYEIYGGVAGFYDLGPLGVRLKEKILQLWRDFFIRRHAGFVVEIETPIIAPSRVFEASGHLEHFTDPIVECRRCGRKFRADHLIEEKLGIKAEGLSIEEMTRLIREHDIRCPVCGGELGEVKKFNLLFKTTIGPYSENVGYLRPENAQGMFVAFKRVYEAMRQRLPLGIAQIGRVARNEISPRQGMIRLREFTIAEMEFFFDPEDPGHNGLLDELLGRVGDTKLRILRAEEKEKGADEPSEYKVSELVEERIVANPWLAYWMAVARDFIKALGVPEQNMYFEEKPPEERAHYSAQTFDQLVRVSRFGWIEVSGHSYRTDYDLSRHMKHSGQDLRVFKQYREPVIVKRKMIFVDRAWLGKTYREKAKKVLQALQELDPESAEKELAEKGFIEVAEVRIPADRVKIIEKEEKVTGKRFLPHVVEPSFGVERLLLVTLDYAHRERDGRTILSLPRYLAPIEVAVFPLTRDEKLVAKAKEVFRIVLDAGFYPVYDDDGSIGKRYARVDEIGVPVAVTVDYQTLEDNTVTLRDRDTWKQVRVSIDKLVDALRRFLNGADIEELGTIVDAGVETKS